MESGVDMQQILETVSRSAARSRARFEARAREIAESRRQDGPTPVVPPPTPKGGGAAPTEGPPA